jgi:hypothetical protein
MIDDRLLPLVRAGYSRVQVAEFSTKFPELATAINKDTSASQARAILGEFLAESKASVDEDVEA